MRIASRGPELGNTTRSVRARWLFAVAAVAIGISSSITVTAQQREQAATIVSCSAFQSGLLVSGFVPESFAVLTIMAGSLLQTAPIDWNDLNNPTVWTVLAAGTLVNVGFNLLSAEKGQAIWDTGTSYLGDVQAAPVLGVAAALGIGILNNTLTGATEEALPGRAVRGAAEQFRARCGALD